MDTGQAHAKLSDQERSDVEAAAGAALVSALRNYGANLLVFLQACAEEASEAMTLTVEATPEGTIRAMLKRSSARVN